METKDKIIKEDELDLKSLLESILSQRKLVALITTFFFAFGLLVAFTSKVEYVASCKLLPEINNPNGSNLQGLSGLAGLAGLDLSNISGNGLITSELFPEIIRSTAFLEELANEPIYFEKHDTLVTSMYYFKEIDTPDLLGYFKAYTVGLPRKIKTFFFDVKAVENKDYGMIRYSKTEWQIFEKISERLLVSIDPNTSIILVQSEMPDAVAAAQTTSLVVEKLKERIRTFEAIKSNENLKFVQERFDDAKAEYQKVQNELAIYQQKNYNLTNSLVQVESQRIQNELDIAFAVYKGLATQLEKAKIRVKEETPVFTVLEPVKIPVNKAKPKRALILAISTVLGLFIAIVASLFKS